MLPLVPLYLAGAALRWAGVKPKRLGCPVISVGNLSTGGTGKTPLVIALAQLLKREGVRVDVLSRGYGRKERSATWVKTEGKAEQYGDEPLLIARQQLMVYVAAERFDAGRLSEALGYQRVVHLLDDGFQHRQLFRDVDVVLVNSEDLADRVLPAGNLREPISALRRASVFAVPVGDGEAVVRLRELGLERPVWRFRREMVVPQASGPVVAFCGIARPEQFFIGLESEGVVLAARNAFRDHHRFTAEDVELLRSLVRQTRAAALITTEKDFVRLGEAGLEQLKAQCGVPLVTAELRVVFENEGAILEWLRNRLEL